MKRTILLVLLTLALVASGVFAQTTITYTRWAGTQEAIDFGKMVDTFTASHPNIKVTTDFLPWDAYWQKVQTTVLAGNAADVISMASGMQGAFITRGVFRVMDDLPGAKALYAEMAKGGRDADMVAGKIRAMPVGAGVRTMIYNKALLDKAGLTYPDPSTPMTWDKFAAMAGKLSIKTGDAYVQYQAYFHVMEMYEAFVLGYGGQILDSWTKPTKVLINSAKAIQGLTVMQNMFKNSVFPPYTGEWQTQYGTPDDAVATGKIVFEQTGPWGFGPLVDKKIDIGTAPLPVGIVANRATHGYLNSLALARNIKAGAVTNAAWEFVKWACGAEGQLEFTKTGDLPANTKAMAQAQASNPYSSSNAILTKEIMKPFFSELPFVVYGPMLPTSEFGGLVQTALTDMFQMRATPQQTAAKIEKDGNSIIASLFE